jgi:hypothetical protein
MAYIVNSSQIGSNQFVPNVTLNPQNINYAVDPNTLLPLSSNGSPTQTYSLNQNLPTGIVGFKVPQGLKLLIQPQLLVRMTLMNASSVQLNPQDIISLYIKLPSNTSYTYGNLLAQKPYSYYQRIQPITNQYADYYQNPSNQTLYFNITNVGKLIEVPENAALIFAVTSFTTGESVDWTIGYSMIEFEAFEQVK